MGYILEVVMKSILVSDLYQKIKKEDALVFDIRSAKEYEKSHIAYSKNVDRKELHKYASNAKNVPHYIICYSGYTSSMVCNQLISDGIQNVVNVQGGISEWRKLNLPIIGEAKASLSVIRQVMMVAGFLILMGVVLGIYVHSNAIYLSAFVGVGLFYAGASGNCFMARLLSLMPWNK